MGLRKAVDVNFAWIFDKCAKALQYVYPMKVQIFKETIASTFQPESEIRCGSVIGCMRVVVHNSWITSRIFRTDRYPCNPSRTEITEEAGTDPVASPRPNSPRQLGYVFLLCKYKLVLSTCTASFEFWVFHIRESMGLTGYRTYQHILPLPTPIASTRTRLS